MQGAGRHETTGIAVVIAAEGGGIDVKARVDVKRLGGDQHLGTV